MTYPYPQPPAAPPASPFTGGQPAAHPGAADAADDFLRRAGGPPALSFHDKYQPFRWRGIVRGGRVIADPVIRNVTDPNTGEQKTWRNGDPRRQMVVTLACAGGAAALPGGGQVAVQDERDPGNPEDLGHRRLFVQGYMVDALRKAVEEAGVEGVRVGGHLYVAWVGEKKATNPTFNDAKLYHIVYVPPAVAVPAGGGQAPAAPAGTPNPFAQSAAPPQPAPAPPAQPGAQFAPQPAAAPAQPTPTPPGAMSPDGQYTWDGRQWVPTPPAAPAAPPPPAGYAQPAPAGAPPAVNPFTGR